MKKTYRQLTMLLCLLLVLAVPVQIFGAERDCTSYFQKSNCASDGAYYQLCQKNWNKSCYIRWDNACVGADRSCSKALVRLVNDYKCGNYSACPAGNSNCSGYDWLSGNKYCGNTGNCGQTACTPVAPKPDTNVDKPPQSGGQTPQTPAPDTGTDTDTDSAGYAKDITALVNEERAAAGLSSLSLNSDLSAVAQAKAQDMADNDYFSHTSPTYGSPFEMMKQFGVSYSNAGENIAMGHTSAEAVMKGWMGSAGHKANILSYRFTEIGVGYVKADDGTTYWVQMFRKP